MSLARAAAALSVSAVSAGAKRGGWFVYVVETKSGKLYSGITVNVKRRLEQHSGTRVGGAKAVARRPARAPPVRGDRGGPLRGDEA
jgi:putative endonuclease